jgi:hypothetical protein
MEGGLALIRPTLHPYAREGEATRYSSKVAFLFSSPEPRGANHGCVAIHKQEEEPLCRAATSKTGNRGEAGHVEPAMASLADYLTIKSLLSSRTCGALLARLTIKRCVGRASHIEAEEHHVLPRHATPRHVSAQVAQVSLVPWACLLVILPPP